QKHRFLKNYFQQMNWLKSGFFKSFIHLLYSLNLLNLAHELSVFLTCKKASKRLTSFSLYGT
ncbi:hypothetical protein DB41_JS00010, partial [Neochlamydia sp. TUME1]